MTPFEGLSSVQQIASTDPPPLASVRCLQLGEHGIVGNDSRLEDRDVAPIVARVLSLDAFRGYRTWQQLQVVERVADAGDTAAMGVVEHQADELEPVALDAVSLPDDLGFVKLLPCEPVALVGERKHMKLVVFADTADFSVVGVTCHAHD